MDYGNANERAAAGIDIGSAELCDRLIAAMDRNAELIAGAILAPCGYRGWQVTARDHVDASLLPSADWQTPYRGTDADEYEIYTENARALGWEVKTYEEWLKS